jgi:tRNA U34 5-methylaminomethyl-2-thiouridine-forming methyltransferase MnmC
MSKLQLLKTKDDSYTLYNPDLNETYHSKHGAVQESLHVFIKNGLHYYSENFPTNDIHILELGFGTGLNALLTLIESKKLNNKIHYTSTEAFPLAIDIVEQLNYSQEHFKDLLEMHQSKKLNKNNFEFDLICDAFMKINFNKKFDIIYFDAFAPEKQPELWTQEVFLRCKELLNPNGLLVTYCAKGEVKRTIKSVGLKLETLQGPPGKREMIRANKI